MFTATIGRMTLSLADTSNVFAIIAASHADFPFNTPVPDAVAPVAPVAAAPIAPVVGGAEGPADTAATLPPLLLLLPLPLPFPPPPTLPPPPPVFLSTWRIV